MTQPGGERVGSVYVDVEPNTSGFERKLETDVLPAAQRLGGEIANRISAPIARKISDAITDGLRLGGAAAEAAADRVGERIGDKIGRSVRTAIEKQLAAAIKVKIDADIDPAEKKIKSLEKKLAAIGTTRVRIDLDLTRARADLTSLQRDIRSLSGTASVTLRLRIVGESDLRRVESRIRTISGLAAAGAHLNVSVSGNAAVNQLARDLRAVNRLGTINIRIQTHGVMQALADLHTIAAFARTLGTINPHITVTVNATLAIARLAVVLGMAASVGAMNPTITININISGLLPAQAGLAAINQQAGHAQTRMLGLAAAGVLLFALLAPAAAGVAAAIMSIVTAIVAAGAAFAVIGLALYGVVQAISAVTAAQEEAGQGAAQMASKQNAIKAAADGVRNAERALAGAQREARTAQEDLTRAREDARKANEDLAISVRENSLSQRQAQLDVKDAKLELDKVLADPSATQAQREQAQITYDRAVLQIDDLSIKGKRLAAEKKKADQQGVEGSDQVRAAQERVRAANEAVVVATEQLAAAHRQAAQAATQAGEQGNSALQKMQQTLAALSPEGRQFVKFVVGLKDELLALRRAAEAGFLPGLQRGIEAFLPVLPYVTQFVQRFAVALGDLAERAFKALASPFWIDFFDFLGTTGLRILVDFLEAIGYMIKGFASLIMAFGPMSEEFSTGLAGMAKKFADWAAAVGESQGFKDFVTYTRENGPLILALLGQFTLALVKLGIAFSPLGIALAKGLTALFEAISNADPGPLIAIATVGGLLLVVFGAMAGAAGAVILGITLIAAGFAYAYTHFDSFRKIVDTVASRWVAFAKVMFDFYQQVFDNVIKPAAIAWGRFAATMGAAYVWLWQNVIKPTGEAIGTAALWLWRNVLEPAWRGIQAAIQIAWSVIRPIWNALATFVRVVLGPTMSWLYENVIRHVWEQIQIVIGVAWASIKVIFGLIQIAVKILGAVFGFFYENQIKPIWNAVAAVIDAVWTTRIKPILEIFGNFIQQHVAPRFASAVEGLKSIWGSLAEASKVPIKFIVDTVLNNGLLAAYNWLAEKFNVEPKNVRINVPGLSAPAPRTGGGGGGGVPRFMATGGYVSGPGTATSDSIMARLSNGEYVIPASVVGQLGVDFFDWLIGKKRSRGRNQQPGDGSEGLAFADGGLVGWLKGAWNVVTDPVGELKRRADGLLNAIPGGQVAKAAVLGMGRRVVNGVVDYARKAITNLFTSDGYAGPISADVASVRDFVARQAGKPYIWASAGPRGYDCSGIVSAAWNMLHGRNPYSHTFSTHYMHNYFTKRNVVGPLTAGWSHAGQREGGSVGHTAANIAGLPFESRGSRGVITGRDVRPFGNFAQWGTFDTGGWLMPGLTYAYNGTGKPERILTNDQWSAMSGGTGGTTYNVYPQRAEFSIQDLDALTRRRDALARVGRPA